MHHFRYVGNQLYCEKVSVESLVTKHGTPLYVYSQATLTDHYQRLDRSLAPLDHLICYAMKANSNLAVMRVFANQGSGFDIVSEGELRRVIAAGGDPKKCMFAGVGKTENEIEFAIRQGIYSFNVESEPELQRINKVAARLKKVAPVALRVNPNVDAGTHAKITTGTYANKFGIAYEEIEAIYARASKLKNIRLHGLQTHIGSQITEVKPFELAVQKIVPLVEKLAKAYQLEFFSIGGGIGIVYNPAFESGANKWWETPEAQKILTPAKYAETLVPLLQPLGLKILLEPGRFLVGNSGILVTRVEYVKNTGKKTFVIVDGAMNDLIRPSFYDAYHQIVPLRKKNSATLVSSDVVGPICESGDYFCKDRPLPKVGEGDYLALLSAGAYGSVMSCNYNSRALAAEVLVNGDEYAVVRQRQKVEEIWAGERIPSWLAQKPVGSRVGAR
jgi:diaminopimelate decarboxylase